MLRIMAATWQLLIVAQSMNCSDRLVNRKTMSFIGCGWSAVKKYLHNLIVCLPIFWQCIH